MVGNYEGFFPNHWFRLLARAILQETNGDSGSRLTRGSLCCRQLLYDNDGVSVVMGNSLPPKE